MAKKFDPSKYEYYKPTGKFYVKGGSEVTNPKVLKQLREAMGHSQSTARTRSKSLAMPSKYNKLFSPSSFKSKEFVRSSRVLALTGGKNPEYGWSRAFFEGVGKDGKPATQKDVWTRKWGTLRNQLSKKDIGKTKIGKGVILKGGKDWIRHIRIAIHQLQVNAENFRVIVGHRALKVFQMSFSHQRFYSTGSQKWAPLSLHTKEKRKKRGTGSRILKEFGDLYSSIKIHDSIADKYGVKSTRVYTDLVGPRNKDEYKSKKDDKQRKYKKHTLCYAGLHNNPRPGYTYGNSRRPYIQRQFMGHSNIIDSFALSKLRTYFFDNVFLIKKV